MKKLLITASSWGHIQSFHLPYLTEFHRLGWQVHLGCANPSEKVDGVAQIFNLPFQKKMTALENFKTAVQLRKDIAREGYDLVICHTSLAAFFTRLAVMGLRGRPRVINMVHGYLFDDDTPTLKKIIYLGAEKVTAPVTDLILTMNQWDTDIARQHKLARAVKSVPGIGVPLSKYEGWRRDDSLRRQLGVGEKDILLIYPAEFSKRKNQKFLISALAKLPQHIHLVLPGKGLLLEDCKVFSQTLDLDNRVHFPGFVTDLPRWYGIADIAVTVSHSEGLPFNVMEGMASGLPVVASRVKGHTDLVSEGETGLLFAPNQIDDLVAVIACLAQNTDLRQKMGEAGRTSVAQYGLEQVLPQVMSAYGQGVSDVALYVACHQAFSIPAHRLLRPIQVGAARGKHRFPGFVQDDTGEHISLQNPRYCELTAQYWAWKNDEKSDYLGFFHYRRFLYPDVSQRQLYKLAPQFTPTILDKLDFDQMSQLAYRHDIIAPKGEDMKISVREHYATAPHHHSRDLELVESILRTSYPEYIPAMEEYLGGTVCYFGNLYIMRRGVFCHYCEFLFHILSEFDNLADVSGYNQQELRVDGYLAERIFGIYLTKFRADGGTTLELPRIHITGGGLSHWKQKSLNFLLPPGSSRRANIKGLEKIRKK